MRTLDLGKYRKARVWIGTLPDAAYSPREVITRVFSAGAGMRTETRAVAIEILVPLGPRSMYGLLGCHFNPDRMGQLGVDVHVASSNGPVLPDSLATRGDEVRIGLPAEYAGAILAGVSLEKDQIELLGSGKLLFDCAAHGVVGSCEAIYKHLAATLIKILNAASVELSDEELVGMFPQTFS